MESAKYFFTPLKASNIKDYSNQAILDIRFLVNGREHKKIQKRSNVKV